MAPRLIDSDNAIATRTLKVCCIGLPRTGTQDLALALSNLGYRPYHGSEIVKNGRRDMELLLEALVLKQSRDEETEAYGQPEFDRIWGKYDVLLDLPGFAFVDEVLACYPDVKFILSDRNVDEWLQVMQVTVFAKLTSWSSFFRSMLGGEHARAFRLLMRKWAQVFCGFDFKYGAREAYIDHVKHCLKVVPKERLLILHYEDEDDWQDLCEFLGKEVPEVPYPGTSDPWRVEVTDTAMTMCSGWRSSSMSLLIGASLLAVAMAIWCAWSGENLAQRQAV